MSASGVRTEGGAGRGRRGAARRAERAEREDPEPVGGLVGSLLERLGIAEKVLRARAAAEWEETVGPHIARVTRNPVVRGRALFVEVESAAWLAELNIKRHELLRRINAGRERGRIEKIVFVQSDGRRRREGSRGRRGADG